MIVNIERELINRITINQAGFKLPQNQKPQKKEFSQLLANKIQDKKGDITVKAGDTVSQLAVKYQTSIDAIVQTNNLQNPNLILTGQILHIQSKSKEDQAITLTGVTNDVNAATSLGDKIVKYAKQFLGDKYVWGQAQPGAFDCSGLVKYAYARFGVDLPHLAQAQADKVNHISTSQAQAGDLLFWQNKQGHVVHVGIASGDGHYINALNPQQGVRIDGMAQKANFAGRVI